MSLNKTNTQYWLTVGERFHPPIEELVVVLQKEVEAAPPQRFNTNAGFEEEFGKIFSATDAARPLWSGRVVLKG